MQAFINQIEGRYRIDTCGEPAPGRIPEAIEAAPHLAERQAEREQATQATQAREQAAQATPATTTPRNPSSRRQLITDVLCALVVTALLTFVLSGGEPLRGW